MQMLQALAVGDLVEVTDECTKSEADWYGAREGTKGMVGKECIFVENLSVEA